jgi:hypothetical protein
MGDIQRKGKQRQLESHCKMNKVRENTLDNGNERKLEKKREGKRKILSLELKEKERKKDRQHINLKRRTRMEGNTKRKGKTP